MKQTAVEFKGWLTVLLIKFAFNICPFGKFKIAFAIFIKDNIKNI